MTDERHDPGRDDSPPGGDDATVTRRERNDEVWLASSPPDATGGDRLAASLRTLVADALAGGATAVHWETEGGTADAVNEVAARAGLAVARDILRLERALPLPGPIAREVPAITTRALRPGTADEAAWVRCNNRAFADHPDQGRESIASLHAAMAQPWFDASGFLLLDADPPVDAGGGLDGFCWTKVHPADATGPAAGEIYVIGVDPDAAGRRLGAALVAAGLDHMVAAGLTRVLLYVDAGNAPARRLYDRLGFVEVATRRVRSTASGQVTE